MSNLVDINGKQLPSANKHGDARGKGARRVAPPGGGAFVSRNILVRGRRTSARLEAAMWEALDELCRREGLTIHQPFDRIDRRRNELSLSAAIRVFIMSYYRAAATESGHACAGHGALYAPRRLRRLNLESLA